MTFMLAMLLFPETQAKAQKEIDSVTGGNRLPTMEDAAQLPYVDRLIREVLRWQPAAPLGTRSSHLYPSFGLNKKSQRYLTLATKTMSIEATRFPSKQLCKFTSKREITINPPHHFLHK
jgi:hypothetical protein